VANRKKTAKKHKPTHPLPKVGTPADDAYRLKRSREDLVDFGLARGKRGGLNWLIAGLALVVLVAGAIALIVVT
jgi:hypothetical protein